MSGGIEYKCPSEATCLGSRLLCKAALMADGVFKREKETSGEEAARVHAQSVHAAIALNSCPRFPNTNPRTP